MPLLIDPADIDKVKRSADLAAIVRAHGVVLKRSRKQLVGKCPFHAPDNTPSFFVDPAAGKWKCFGACAAGGDDVSGGDAISFFMRAENLTFPEAYAKAGGTIVTKDLPPPRVKHALSAAEGKSNGNGHRTNDLTVLDRLADFYHRVLLTTSPALEYLAGRGIASIEILKAYRIGYADGSLLGKTTGALRAALGRLGVIAGDRELLRCCIIVPLLDASGVVVNLYGRAIDRDQHLYLPGKQRGLFNAATLRGADEIILVESIIDAVSAIQAGVMNVLPLYGAGGFTPDHEALLTQIKPQRIALALDNDEAGHAATAKLAEILAPDFDVRVVEIERKDLNEVLMHDGIEALRSALAETDARIGSPTSPGDRAAAKEETAAVTIDGSELTYTSGPRSYVVRGIDGKGRNGSVRVGVKLTVGEKRVVDNVDLVSARSRGGFVTRAAEAELGERGEIDHELLFLLETIEKLQQKKNDSPQAAAPTMSEADRREGEEMLLRPDVLDVVAQDMELLGYVGEVVNKQLGYLVAISRLLEAPLSMVIMSQSGSGKSALADVLEMLTPPEDVFLFSRLSAQSLFWMESDALRHKFIIVEERAGSAEADYSIRALQSKKRLVLLVPIKDPSTGRIKTQIVEIFGPAAFLETTTERYIHPENSTRCFEMYCDESSEQTRRIHEAQRRSKTLEGREAQHEWEPIIRRHHNAQRMLERVGVVIPYADLIDFPFQWLRTRRDNVRFLNLIEVIAFLHQRQREKKRDRFGAVYIEASMADYERAYALAAEVLGQTLTDVKKPVAEFYQQMKAITAKKNDVSRRELREATGLPDHRVSALLADLVRLEYVEVLGGSQGRAFRYRIASHSGAALQSLAGLTTPEELRRRIEARQTATTSKLSRSD